MTRIEYRSALRARFGTVPSGVILWEGRSILDGAPIAAIATLETSNAKTGDMLQTWILRTDVAPHTATQTGQDVSVCGDCKHRPALGGACYVTVFQAPLSVFKAYQRGAYPRAQDAASRALVGASRMVRLGAYGDPMAVPAEVWQDLTRDATGRTGYTHQWANPAIDPAQRAAILALCMASVDSAPERDAARSQGLRYFRIRTADESLAPREFVCPASEEANNPAASCAKCGACSGTSAQRVGQASPVIIVHGAKATRFPINPA